MSKPSKSPRKSPAQKRSIQMVEAILEGSVRILKSMEMDKLSTKIVAKLSGVSIGSFYQYFPNKEALVGALIEREMKKQVELLERKYNEVAGQSLEAVVVALCEELIMSTERNQQLLKNIFSNTFFLERLDHLIEVREHLVQFVEKVLVQSGIEGNLYGKAYTIVATFPGVMETVMFRKNKPISAEELSREVSSMICAYCRAQTFHE